MIHLIGDVHGKMDFCRKLVKRSKKQDPNGKYIQVGDLGIGFPKSQSSVFSKDFHFIRGNHDSPDDCRLHKNYMGDFGSKVIDGRSIFFVSGAWSIDREGRTEGVSWWHEEELSMFQCYEAMQLYCDIKPDIVITHDGPTQATHNLLIGYPHATRTGQLLSAMFEQHKPKLWAFGHWHRDWRTTIDGTQFVCCPIPESEEDFFSF